MNKEIFDLIVVYSENIANSAKDKTYTDKAPFPSKGSHSIYNDSYKYFLSKCKQFDLNAASATSKDIIGPGLFQSFWTYNKKWIRHKNKAYSNILFDKFTTRSYEQRSKLKLLTSSKDVYMFNNKKIIEMFQDKLNTYKHFKKFAIPTVDITNLSIAKIQLAKIKLNGLLKKHKYREDFSSVYIIKDREGAGGFRIFKFDFDTSLKEIKKRHRLDIEVNYVLQPFIDGDKSFIFGKYKGFIDVRVILLNNKIIQAYIRIAKRGNFKCNEHQGGNLVYIPKRLIPKDVLKMIPKITKKLNFKHALYALDFIKSNNGNLYFIEGNTNPGLDWNHKKKINEIRSKELIDLIINELKIIIAERKLYQAHSRKLPIFS
ncbi:MAG: ATP-grasp domain-containing protein [Candidatus Woesearchaeota archaeon]